MTEFRVNDVDLQEFLHSFTDGDGKLPSDFELLKREGYCLIHGDASRRFCLKEKEIYLKDTMENLLAKSLCYFSNMPISYAVHVKASGSGTGDTQKEGTQPAGKGKRIFPVMDGGHKAAPGNPSGKFLPWIV